MFTRDKAPARLSWHTPAFAGVLGLLLLPARSMGQGESPKKEQPPQAERTTAETPAAQGAVRKIEALEARILQLEKELELQRSPTWPAAVVQERTTAEPGPTTTVRPTPGPTAEPGATTTPSGPEEVLLSRVVYKLPAGHAEATAAFLREHAGAPTLDARAEGDAVVVTTTPEAQKVIRQLMALVRQSKPVVAPPKAEEPTPLPPATDVPSITPGSGPGPVKPPTPVTPKTSAAPPAAPQPFSFRLGFSR